MHTHIPEQNQEFTVALPRIAFVYVGDESPVFQHSNDFYGWLTSFSEVAMIARISGHCVDVQSTTDSFSYITQTAQWIHNNQEEYEGFVVFLPRAAFLYATQLLQLMIRESGKPIVCTTDYGLGAAPQFRSFDSMLLKSDMLNAVQTAISSVSGVMIVAGQEVVAPELAVIDVSGARPVVRSRSVQLIGRMQFGFIPHPSASVRSNRAVVCDPFSPDVVAYRAYGTNTVEQVQQIQARADIRGLIVESENPVPISFVGHLPKGIPTLLTSSEGHQLFNDGVFHEIPALPAALASARFTWLRAHIPALSASATIERMSSWANPQLTDGRISASV